MFNLVRSRLSQDNYSVQRRNQSNSNKMHKGLKDRRSIQSSSAAVERQKRRTLSYLPLIDRLYGDHYVDTSNLYYDDAFYPLMEEKQSYGGGGGYSTGCCGSSGSSSILKALLLSILIPLALLLALGILLLFATALKTYGSCLLGMNVTINGTIYYCTGLFGGLGGFGSFGGINIIR